MTLTVVVGGVGAFLVGVVGTRAALLAATRRSLFDHPDHRSSHVVPTPRIGGIGIVLGTLLAGVSALLWASRAGVTPWPVLGVMLGGIVCAANGLLDDLVPGGLRPRHKFGGQLVAAVLTIVLIALASGGGVTIPGPLGRLIMVPVVLFGLLWIVALVNFVNFMDGTDGLAGGIGAILLFGYVLATIDPSEATLAYATACGASVLGFLIWNWPPARIFMGDGGSLFLGHAAAAVGIWTALPSVTQGTPTVISETPLHAPLAALILVAPFWVDPVATIALRAVRGRRLSEAHRDHFYQRMIRNGFSHTTVALTYYGYSLACVVTVALLAHLALWVGVAVGAVVMAVGILAVLLGHKAGVAVAP